MAIFQQQPIVTNHPFVALQNHSQHVPPYQFQRAGGGAPPPPQINSCSIEINPMGGGGVIIDSITFFWGGGGGGRALSFDISILSRGQINFEPTPIFVNKNSSFALPELAFVIFPTKHPLRISRISSFWCFCRCIWVLGRSILPCHFKNVQ